MRLLNHNNLFSFIFRSAFVPHTEQILQQLEGLLPIDPTPEIAGSSAINGFRNSSNLNESKLMLMYPLS